MLNADSPMWLRVTCGVLVVLLVLLSFWSMASNAQYRATHQGVEATSCQEEVAKTSPVHVPKPRPSDREQKPEARSQSPKTPTSPALKQDGRKAKRSGPG